MESFNIHYPLFLAIFSTILSFSCSRNEQVKYIALTPEKSGEEVHYERTEVLIPIDSTISNTFEHPQYKFLSGEDYIFSFNSNTYNVTIYNRRMNSIDKKIELENEGPNGLGNIRDFYVHNWDTIFIMSDFTIYIIDTTGHIQQTFDVNYSDDGSQNYSPFVLTSASAMGRFGMWYDPKRQFIYSYYHPSDIPLNHPEYYKYSIEAQLSLHEKTISELPTYYSNLYLQKDSYYGYLNIPLRSVSDSFFIYSFLVDPNIYLYNRETKKTYIKGGKSKFINEEAPTLNFYEENSEKMMEHLIRSPLYFNVLVDPYRKLFYRFQLAPVEFRRGDGKYNGLKDKQISLMVFDDEFRIIEELEMTEYSSQIISSFVTPEGLWLPNSKNESEDVIKYDILKFSKRANEK